MLSLVPIVVPEISVTSLFDGFFAVTNAEFVTFPASTSAWVIIYVPVIVESVAPAAKLAIGFPVIVKPTIGSITITLVKVVVPVFVTAKV